MEQGEEPGSGGRPRVQPRRRTLCGAGLPGAALPAVPGSPRSQPGQAGRGAVSSVTLSNSTRRRSAGVEHLGLGQVVERLGQRLDVGPVRPEQHPVGAHPLDDRGEVVLPERVDPDVAAEDLDRIVGEPAPHLAVDRPQLAEQVGQELGAVLDRRDPQVRELLEVVREHHRQQVVVDRLLDGEVLERRLLAAARTWPRSRRPRSPSDDTPLSPACTTTVDARLVHPRPERVEHRVERRPPADRGGRRGRAHHDEPCALAERPLELVDRPLPGRRGSGRARRRCGRRGRSPSRRAASG